VGGNKVVGGKPAALEVEVEVEVEVDVEEDDALDGTGTRDCESEATAWLPLRRSTATAPWDTTICVWRLGGVELGSDPVGREAVAKARLAKAPKMEGVVVAAVTRIPLSVARRVERE